MPPLSPRFLQGQGGAPDFLACLTLGSPLAQGLDAFEHELQAVASPFRAGHNLLDVEEQVGIAHLLAPLLQERMDLRTPVGGSENLGAGPPLSLRSIHIIADIRFLSQFL